MYYVAGTLAKCHNSLLKRLFHASKFFDSANSTAKHTVNPVLKFMHHISDSCNNGNTFFIIFCCIFIWNQQHDPVSHNWSNQTLKEILSNFTECRIEFVCFHTCTNCITQHTILQRITKFHNHHIAIFLLNIQKLRIIILISNKIILQQYIVDIPALDHRYNCFQFLSDT